MSVLLHEFAKAVSILLLHEGWVRQQIGAYMQAIRRDIIGSMSYVAPTGHVHVAPVARQPKVTATTPVKRRLRASTVAQDPKVQVTAPSPLLCCNPERLLHHAVYSMLCGMQHAQKWLPLYCLVCSRVCLGQGSTARSTAACA